MTKLTLASISSGYMDITTLNSNFSAITDAIENTISRDGTSPNSMSADFDMNSYRILNVENPVNDSDGVNKGWILANASSSLTNVTNAFVTPTGGNNSLTVADLASLTVKPESFEAIGNGTDDDSIAVQAAITYAYTNGLAVELSKEYLISSNITNLHDVNYVGRGRFKIGSDYFRPNSLSADSLTVYVDTAGVSTNDGLSTGNAVNNITNAVAIVKKYSPLVGNWSIELASGTYDEPAQVDLDFLGMENLEILGASETNFGFSELVSVTTNAAGDHDFELEFSSVASGQAPADSLMKCRALVGTDDYISIAGMNKVVSEDSANNRITIKTADIRASLTTAGTIGDTITSGVFSLIPTVITCTSLAGNDDAVIYIGKNRKLKNIDRIVVDVNNTSNSHGVFLDDGAGGKSGQDFGIYNSGDHGIYGVRNNFWYGVDIGYGKIENHAIYLLNGGNAELLRLSANGVKGDVIAANNSQVACSQALIAGCDRAYFPASGAGSIISGSSHIVGCTDGGEAQSRGFLDVGGTEFRECGTALTSRTGGVVQADSVTMTSNTTDYSTAVNYMDKYGGGIFSDTDTGIDIAVGNITVNSSSPNIEFIDGASSANINANSGNIYLNTASTNRDVFFQAAGVEKGKFDMGVPMLDIGGNQIIEGQQAAVADATDAASAITQLNALLAAARAHGLLAT